MGGAQAPTDEGVGAWKWVIDVARPDCWTRKTRAPEWRRLRSQWRYLSSLFCYVGPPCHLLWRVKWPLLAVMAVTVSLAGYELARASYPWLLNLDKGNITYSCVRLSSFAMALLLTLRLNRSYERWWAARQAFGGIGSGAIALAQQAANWIPDEALAAEITRWAVVWHYSALQVLTSAEALHPAGAAMLHPRELEVYAVSQKGRYVVASKVRALIEQAHLPFEKFTAMESAVQKTMENLGVCTRIKFQALPIGVGLCCTGFLQIWLLFLPLGLWNDADWFGIIAVFWLALLLLGVDEVANQMEDPFGWLPLEAIVESTQRDAARALPEAKALRALVEQGVGGPVGRGAGGRTGNGAHCLAVGG